MSKLTLFSAKVESVPQCHSFIRVRFIVNLSKSWIRAIPSARNWPMTLLPNMISSIPWRFKNAKGWISLISVEVNTIFSTSFTLWKVYDLNAPIFESLKSILEMFIRFENAFPSTMATVTVSKLSDVIFSNPANEHARIVLTVVP